MPARLPDGFTVRPVTVDDAEVIADLINECTRAEVGFPWTTTSEVLDDLTGPDRDPATDDAIVLDADGTPCASLAVFADVAPYTEVFSLVYAHPRWWGQGLSAYLLRLGEERARAKVDRAPPGERVVLQVARFVGNEAAGTLFESCGFAYTRTFWGMQIELGERPPPSDLPEGITIRGFDAEREARPVYDALAEAFADHWGHAFPSFEQWRHYSITGQGADFDPGLWFVAVDGDEVAGVAFGRPRSGRDVNTAELDELGVRRAWRRRGIGVALLSAAFEEFSRRGIERAELGVDAESPTGATRLYERAGMHVAFSWEFWEKELRA
jgi:GNAT superfamily N-acetyltransferase